MVNLGKQLKEYQRSRGSFLKLGLISLFSVGIAAIIFGTAFFGSGNGLGAKIGLSLLATFFLLPALAGVYMLVSRRGSCVTLYEKGLVYRRGGKEFSANWDEIVSYTQSSACRIAKKDGETFDFGENIENFKEVAQQVEQQTLNRLLPQVQAAIRSGKSVAFPGLKAEGTIPLSDVLNKTLLGKEGFAVDSQGISSDGRNIPWTKVVEFGVAQGEGRQAVFSFFKIRDNDVSLQMNYGTLPNAHVLLALCEDMVKRK